MTMFEGYRISSPFGMRTLSGVRQFHKGIDLVKNHREPIYAFTAGEVVHAQEGKRGTGFGNYGIVVAIKDKHGSLHCYCHLDCALVKEGQKVEQDDLIGRQGNTGKVVPLPTVSNPAGGSHLHYEIRKTSSPSYGWAEDPSSVYDPTDYLEEYYAREAKPKKLTSYSDVEAGRWSETQIAEAKELGLMDGYPDGTFKPGEPMTREEQAVAAVRLYKKIQSLLS